jgi:hypothetical protein
MPLDVSVTELVIGDSVEQGSFRQTISIDCVPSECEARSKNPIQMKESEI